MNHLPRFTLLLGLGLTCWQMRGQPAAPPTNAPPTGQDPLMQLMLSQPRLDFDAPVTATAMFDPPVGRAGDRGIFRVTISALEQSIEWPERLAGPEGLNWEKGARGQVLQLAGAGMQPRTTFNYRVRADRPGSYSMPEFTVDVYGKPVRVPAAQWLVQPANGAAPANGEKLILEFPETNLFVGQPATARILLRGSLGGVVQGISQVQINGRGLMTDMGAVRQRIESTPLGGIQTAAYVFETLVTPVNTGEIEVFAQGFTVGNRFAGPITITGSVTIPGGPPQYTLLESDTIKVRVQPLPRAGELPGFTGAIGRFLLDPPQLSTNLTRVGDPLRLTAHLRAANGQPIRLVPPPPPPSREWQILPFSPEQAGGRGAQPVATFDYTLIPLSAAVTRTPVIPFSYFDPLTRRHVDLSIPGLPVTVLTNSEAGQVEALLAAAELESARPQDLTLQELSQTPGSGSASLVPLQEQAWFPLVQATPAVFFLGLWVWDRRRRFLEDHPALVRRRKALRRLKRDRARLARLGREGETMEYLRTATLAIQNAAAAHYPAEPRALVCGDVLAVLGGAARAGRPGRAVRELFQLTDSAAYSQADAEPRPRSLKSDISVVLDTLERALEEGGVEPGKTAGGTLPDLDLIDTGPAGAALKLGFLLLLGSQFAVVAASADRPRDPFRVGMSAYRDGRYTDAAAAFRAAARGGPSAGALGNLGNAEWQRNRVGAAVLAWEQALWVDPRHQAARLNLEYARKTAQLESPELGWNEVLSSWLPQYWWAWTAGFSLWTAVGMLTLPGIFRRKRESWHQAAAALALGIFLLSIPAHWGTHTRTQLGFVQLANTTLRLTPTSEAQAVTLLAPGEPLRRLREQGDFILVETSRNKGWVKREEAGFLTQLAGD
jgi:tetratricopeptide (TPR) repeat protein